MNRINLGVGVALGLLAGRARADLTNCIAAWTTACDQACATAQCVSNCTTQAQQQCTKNLAAPQQVFNGPVTATPANQCPSDSPPACAPSVGAATGCSTISGTVANNALWGGLVTIYVICPNGSSPGTTTLGSGPVNTADGTFSFTVTNACGGPTGCYGLFAVTSAGDPVWGGCTSSVCPSSF